MWSTKQIDWQPDGSDLMQEAEGYYQELKVQRLWSKKGAVGQMYINEATVQEEEDSILAELHENVENKPHVTNASDKGITALTLQLKKLNKKIHKKSNDQKYKWKLIPPKSGESSTKLIIINSRINRLSLLCGALYSRLHLRALLPSSSRTTYNQI
jgi:hypothetical protein